MVRSGLNFKEREVLRIIVEKYTEEGEWANSFYVAEKLSFKASPPTVRNIMASLEAKGYLSSPSKKGRIPTEKALKIYIDSLLKVKPWKREKQTEGIDIKFTENLEELIKQSARVLSEKSQNLSLLVSPSFFYIPFSHVKFFRLQENVVLVILRSLKGLLLTKTVIIDRDYPQEKLDKISDILNLNFKGRTLREVADIIEEGFQRGGKLLRELIQFMRKFMEEREIYVEGEVLIVEKLKGNFEKIRGILKLFEQKKEILNFLGRLELGHEIQVIWGEEMPFDYSKDCVFLLYSYLPKGIIAIFGPKYMSYTKALAALDNLGGYLRNTILEVNNE
ncbi:MAG: hypothetical protein J7L62_01580 [Candidatus Aminicenantes bacterium]|nr:hypothetical protein [Candidatus Aminicenantes bacterium]